MAGEIKTRKNTIQELVYTPATIAATIKIYIEKENIIWNPNPTSNFRNWLQERHLNFPRPNDDQKRTDGSRDSD
jgi:hypothetical protein